MEDGLKDVLEDAFAPVQLDDAWGGFPTAQDLFNDLSKQESPDQHCLAHLLGRIEEAKEKRKYFCDFDTRRYYMYFSPSLCHNKIYLSEGVFNVLMDHGFILYLKRESGTAKPPIISKCSLDYKAYKSECFDPNNETVCHSIEWETPRPCPASFEWKTPRPNPAATED